MSLLEGKQHEKYYIRGRLNLHPDGLFGYYRSKGFGFLHISMTDYQRPSENDMKKALEAFDQLSKPVLVHCSAGIGRTAPVAAYIVAQHGNLNVATNA